MLRIDTAELSVPEIEAVIADRCATFGTVRRVSVCTGRADSPVRPFAMIYMETLEAARNLANAFHRGPIGLVVIIPIEPVDRSFPLHAGTRQRARHDIRP